MFPQLYYLINIISTNPAAILCNRYVRVHLLYNSQYTYMVLPQFNSFTAQ